MKKIVTKDEYAQKIKSKLKAEGKKVILCHGVFDLVHPGHIMHFEQAKQMGDILVVSITSAPYVRKGPNRPYFNDEMRMRFLEAIECIDFVMLSEGYTVDDIIEVVEPDYYVKGEEYKSDKDDVTGMISEERKLVEKHGGKLAFTGGQVFSSTKLINHALEGLPEDVRNYMMDMKKRYSMSDIKAYIGKIEQLKILVIGDTIIDKYTYCAVQGTMSKDMGYSARLLNSEAYLGGAAAIVRHLSTFSANLSFLSVLGSEKEWEEKIRKELSVRGVNLELLQSTEVPTIVKHRYLTRNQKREQYGKVFVINNIPEKPGYESAIKKQLLDILDSAIENYDVVFLCDFGHGMIDRDVMELVQERAKYLALNCQTNSTNKGMNIITKYKRADIFALDQTELKLAYPMYDDDENTRLQKLSKHLGGDGWLTRGAMGAISICGNEIRECPAFTLSVKDTIGAGDAFFALAGVFAAAGAPIEIGTFMGNIGGALGANIIGNKESVEKVNALKFASTLLNV